MTQNQIATVAHILNVELNCDHYHEDKNEIVATWSNENRPAFDDEVRNELSEMLRRWGSALFVSIGEDEYVLIVDKHYKAA